MTCLTLLCLQGWIEWQARTTQVASTQAALLNLATALSQHADDTIDIADHVLFGMAEQAEQPDTAPQRLDRLQKYVAAQSAALFRFHDIAITDSAGHWLATSMPNKGMNAANEAFFRRHQGDPKLGLYISPPIRGIIDGHWFITVSRRYQTADGGFGGVVFAIVDLAYFSDYYARYNLGASSAVALAMTSGELLARYPRLDQFVGQVTKSKIFQPLSHSNKSVTDEISPLDGVHRVAGYHRSARYPLIVAASMSRDQALGGWRAAARWHIALTLVLAASNSLLFIYLMRQATQSRIAEGRLRESESRYRLIADHVSDIVTRVGPDGQRTYVSQAARRIIGVEPEALLGTKFFDFVHPEDRAAMQVRIASLIAGQTEEQPPNFRMIRPDGTQLWIEASTQILRDPATDLPDGYVSVLRDITKRVAVESTIRETEERYRLLVQSGGVTEALYMIDPSGLVETWNAAAEKIKGYTAAEIIGRNFATFFSPEDVMKNEPARLLAAARETGKVETEGWRVRKNGSRFLAHVVMEAIYRDDGSLRGFAKVTHDITAQRIEDEQRAIIIEAAPTGMIIVDEAGIITLANAQVEKLFGYAGGALKGQRVEMLVPNVFDAQAIDDPAAMALGRQCFGRRRDGSLVPVEVMMRLVETPSGEIVVASLIDVSERLRRAEEERETEARARKEMGVTNANLNRLSRHLAKARDLANLASEAKSRFLAGMSHELRTPLNGILGYAQLLQMEGGLNAIQAARVEAMLQAGRHLLQMITSVLDLSEIEGEHVALLGVDVNLHAMAEVCMNVVRPDADKQNLTLRITIDPTAQRKVVADPTRLRQILVNLLANAVKFTAQGSIELRLRPGTEPDTIRIEVADTGIGIAPDKRDRLFQAFERLDIEATRTIEGAGLGLALSARLANLMGGHMGHDDNPGGGSVFWLELPRTLPAEHASPEAEPAPVEVIPGPARSLDVLVVDDVTMNLEVAESFLRAAGHRVTALDDGAAAVAAAEADDFDVILMDVRMPGMDGLEATRRIRALKGPRGLVPIVALTAQVFTVQIEAFRRAGMDSHISKPFDQDTLLAAVAQAAASGHAANAAASGDTANAAACDDNANAASPPRHVTSLPTEIAANLPVVNSQAFQRTAAALTSRTVEPYLRALLEAGEALLHDLRAVDGLTANKSELAETTHRLGGSASIFGFERLAETSQLFEHAVLVDSPDAPAIAQNLIAAVEATLVEIEATLPTDG